MASVTKENEQDKSRPDDADDQDPKAAGPSGADVADSSDDKDDVRELESARRTDPQGGGFFTIYKKGQGYWTRMGTLVGVALIGALLAWTLYRPVPEAFFAKDMETGRKVGIALGVGFIALYGIIMLRLMNKPSYVDFLIATDSEMKKVNWTSRKELIGSCKVVILFMFMMTLYLFINDTVWGFVMYLIRVLKFAPPPFG